jgi:hypothetical protein
MEAKKLDTERSHMHSVREDTVGLDEVQPFGVFIREQRHAKGLTLRKFAHSTAFSSEACHRSSEAS